MHPVVLLHSPLVGPSTLTPLSAALEARGRAVIAPDLTGFATGATPSWLSDIDAAVGSIGGADRVTLIGHSGGGALMPAIGGRLRARMAAGVFVDAVVPALIAGLDPGEGRLGSDPGSIIRRRISARRATAEAPRTTDRAESPFWNAPIRFVCLDVGMAYKPDAALLAALAAVPLFSECSPREVKAVARDGKMLSKKAGSTIVAEEAGGIAFFLILEGAVNITRGEQTVAQLLAGDFFGEMALLSDQPRNASAEAASDVQLFTFTEWAFKSMLLGNPKIAYGVARAVAKRATAA